MMSEEEASQQDDNTGRIKRQGILVMLLRVRAFVGHGMALPFWICCIILTFPHFCI